MVDSVEVHVRLMPMIDDAGAVNEDDGAVRFPIRLLATVTVVPDDVPICNPATTPAALLEVMS